MQKLYVIKETALDNRDEGYFATEYAELSSDAYVSKEKALEKARQLNEKFRSEYTSDDFESHDMPNDIFFVEEVNVLEEEIQDYQTVKEKIKGYREQAKDLASKEFEQVFIPLFEKYPEVETVSFKAYRLYFNDGDTCYYNVHADTESLCVNDTNMDDIMEYKSAAETGQEYGAYVAKRGHESTLEAAREFSETIFSFDEEDIMDMFGEHASITITKNGIESEEYFDHD
jgi:hypothetical protein